MSLVRVIFFGVKTNSNETLLIIIRGNFNLWKKLKLTSNENILITKKNHELEPTV